MSPLIQNRVRDAMVTSVKVLPATATVQDVRRFFADDHVHLAVLADGGTVISAVTREDLTSADGVLTRPARELGSLLHRVVHPDDSLEPVRDQMISRQQRRLVVVGTDLVLHGLLCMKERSRGFCADSDVEARAAATRSMLDRTTTRNGSQVSDDLP